MVGPFCIIDVSAQRIVDAQKIIEETLENIVAVNPDIPENELNDLALRLRNLLLNGIDLNRDDLSPLINLQLLTDLQVQAIINHRISYGKFIDILELQSVPGINVDDILRIQPFLQQIGNKSLTPISLDLLSSGRLQIMSRYVRVLEDKKGYLGSEPAYLGSADRWMTGFRYIVPGRLSAGISMEKDAGEPFNRKYNPAYFDFVSFHVDLNKVNRWVSKIILGDYQVNAGQGLIMNSGFGYGKSSFTTAIKKSSAGFRPSTGINEVDALRGAAIQLELNSHINVMAFASIRKTDGNLLMADTLDPDDQEFTFTSFQSSGLHRTKSEIADKKSIRQFTTGGSIIYKNNGFKLGINSIYDQLNVPYHEQDRFYNRYNFSGEKAQNTSVDYQYLFRNIMFFGEAAMNKDFHSAFIQGALIGLHPKVSLALLYRNLPKDYYSLHGRAFTDRSETSNEKGFYSGLEIKPIPYLVINAFADMYRFDWATFQADAPSVGKDFLFKIAYQKRRKWDTYIQCRYTNEEIKSTSEGWISSIVPRKKLNLRLHFNQKISNYLTWSSRVEWVSLRVLNIANESGTLMYQELWWRPLGKPLSGFIRFTKFNTDSYQSRIYAYEHYVAYDSRNIPLSGNGARFNIGFRYKTRLGMTFEASYNRTIYSGVKSIGSGNELIVGNHVSDIRLQVRYGLAELF